MDKQIFNYGHEWLRQFFIKRPWLIGMVLSGEEENALRNRKPIRFAQQRLEYLRGFRSGYLEARK